MEGTEIGFAEISEVYRSERSSKTLTRINEDFYGHAKRYLDVKEESYKQESKNPSSTTAMMLQDEIRKIRKRLDKIYEIRERKISIAALSGTSGMEKPKNLTPNEKALYESLVEVLVHFRQNNGDSPTEAPKPPTIQAQPTSSKPSEPKTETVEFVEEQKEPVTLVVQVLEDIPSFVGSEGVYNLKKEDVVTLPEKFVDLLLKKGTVKVLETG